MHADRIRLQGHSAAVGGAHSPLLCHLDHPRDGVVLVFNHRAGQAARHKRAVGTVSAVGKYLAANAQPHLLRRLEHLAAGKRQQHCFGCGGLHGAADRLCQRGILGCHIVQCAVGLDMMQRHARCLTEGFQCADLVHHIQLGISRGNGHIAPPEPPQIGKSRVCAHLHAVFFAQHHAFLHHGRIPRVEPAGNVGRAYKGQYLGIHTHCVGAEALPQITVQVDGRHRKAPFFSS